MKILLQILLVSLVMGCSGVASSAEDVIVRTKADPSSPLVGQKVTLTVDVLAREGWATIGTFPLLDISGAYLHRYETQGTRLNESIVGVSYTGQRYEMLLFAHQEGELTIAPFPVEVSVKTWGADATSTSHKLSTETLVLSVSNPEGAAPGDYLPVTNRLDAKQTWSSEKKEYQTGDAIERTVTRMAEDVSAMVFAPLKLPEMEGMSCYPGNPEVNDSFNRGVLSGTRIDTISCILERPGEFSFPEITVSYWNIGGGKADGVVLPGTSFTVVVGGQYQRAGGGKQKAGGDNRIWLFLIAFALVAGVFLYFFRDRFLFLTQSKQKTISEKNLFKQVQKALNSGDKNRALAAIMCWLDRLRGIQQPARLDEFARKFGDEELLVILADLDKQQNWTIQQCHRFYGALQRGRKNYINQKVESAGNNKELPSVGLHY
ncbi:MAG: hypothetical protein ACI8ZB_000799 [Desulforhopalus sp.]|jgi:hypothetical protein